jgi:hypothetical protein
VNVSERRAPIVQTKAAAGILPILNSSMKLVTKDSTYEKAESIEAMNKVNIKKVNHPFPF